MRSMFVFVLILLFGVGCGVGGDGGTVTFERAALAAPAPDPTCTDGVTQFAAAQQIAEAACEALGEDGNAMCMAPIVARYCPDPRGCQALICGEQMVTLTMCASGDADEEECMALFQGVAPHTETLNVSPASFAAAGVTWNPIRAWPNTVTGDLFVPLPLRVGSVLHSVKVNAIGSGSPVSIRFDALRTSAAGVESIEYTATRSPSASWTVYEIPIASGTRLAERETWTVRVSYAGQAFIGNVSARYSP